VVTVDEEDVQGRSGKDLLQVATRFAQVRVTVEKNDALRASTERPVQALSAPILRLSSEARDSIEEVDRDE
jgi:hypothetical protein